MWQWAQRYSSSCSDRKSERSDAAWLEKSTANVTAKTAFSSAFVHFWSLTLILLSPAHNVAVKCDCRRKRRDNGEIRRLSHVSATVWTGFYSSIQRKLVQYLTSSVNDICLYFFAVCQIMYFVQYGMHFALLQCAFYCVTKILQFFLADRTAAHSMIGYCHCRLSACPSDRLPVTKCTVALRVGVGDLYSVYCLRKLRKTSNALVTLVKLNKIVLNLRNCS